MSYPDVVPVRIEHTGPAFRAIEASVGEAR